MSRRLREVLAHPFWQAALILLVAYLVIVAIGWASAPVPRTVVIQYMLSALVGVLIYVSDNEQRWSRFKEPIQRTMVEPERRRLRGSLLVLLPVAAGWVTYRQVRPSVSAPAALRSIHPASPVQLTFRGKRMDLGTLENPLRQTGDLQRHYQEGKRVYYQNCLPCHGDLLGGRGQYAHGFNPTPLPFDGSTIAQLSESVVFWRIAKGGPGLPREGTPWNSAMPVWEDFLTEEEIWQVIIFLYEQAGLQPRRLGAEGEGGAVLSLSAYPSIRLSAQEGQGGGRGKELYDKWCAGCHGETGAGDGPSATRMLPRPRDFTRAVFQVRTTGSGELATDADLEHVIDEGMPGTAMPGWKSRLGAADRDAVIAYLKTFSTFFEGAAPQPLTIGRAPRSTPDGITEGRAVFEKLECFKCHGQVGRGDGQSAPTLTDDWDQPIRAADLSESWSFNGGSSVEQIYARLRTGLDGTPMPSFSDAIDAAVITDEQLWRVAQYVRSLSPKEPPRPQDVIRAAAVAQVPAGPDDSAWAAVAPAFVPLVGQIILKPRWFAPAVNAVWVQALHDGRTLALRLAWHDRSQSPDPGWDEWLGRMQQAMSDGDAPVAAEQGPDRLHVQFPVRLSDGLERPYFLGGSTRQPVSLWRWSSVEDKLQEGTSTGLDRFTPPAAGNASQSARYDRGEWALQVTRSLVPADTAAAIPFMPGRAIPIAFFAADGSNGEDDVRGAVSAWYAIYLDVPAPPRVYVAPIVAVLVTAGLGFAVVRRAQKRELNSVRGEG